jgi:DNA-directed RNA polymerase specialized sigma24 family protein
VVAETFAIAWRRVDAIPAGDQARLWLYGVARNVLAEHRRGAGAPAGLTRPVCRRRFMLAAGHQLSRLFCLGRDHAARRWRG